MSTPQPDPATDPACALARGEAEPDEQRPTLVAVFAAPVATYLLHFGRDLGYRTVLIEPDLDRVRDVDGAAYDHVASAADPSFLDGGADVVVCDHDRPELGPVLRDVLATPTRWVGVMGSPRHAPPHVPALRDLHVTDADIDRVHRPIGLNIGSRTPAEIAVSTLAGLIADRAGRPGGFAF